MSTLFAPALGVDLAQMRATRGGVFVRDLRVGEGMRAGPEVQVSVRYAGFLADGTPIDSAGARDAPVSFRVGRREVIAGWEEGIVGMRVGGRRQLVIPGAMGYGARGAGPIPANATLVFTIDLVDAR